MLGAVAPLVPDAVALAALFGAVAALVVALGALGLYRITVKLVLVGLADLFDVVRVGGFGHYAHPFGTISHYLRVASNAIEHGLESAVIGSEKAVGYLWTQLARQVKWLGRTIGDLGDAVADRFDHMVTVEVPSIVYRSLHGLDARAQKLAHRVAALADVRVAGIEAKLGALERAAEAEIARLRNGIDRVSREATVTLPHELAGVRADVTRWEGRTIRQARRLNKVEALLAGASFAALVATAIGRLGLNWIRCPALGRISKKHGCRPWQALEHLLAPALDVLVVMNICEVATIVRALAQPAGPVMARLVATADGALCNGKLHAAPALKLNAAALNTPTTPLAF